VGQLVVLNREVVPGSFALKNRAMLLQQAEQLAEKDLLNAETPTNK
jgi:hypothetical protein